MLMYCLPPVHQHRLSKERREKHRVRTTFVVYPNKKNNGGSIIRISYTLTQVAEKFQSKYKWSLYERSCLLTWFEGNSSQNISGVHMKDLVY